MRGPRKKYEESWLNGAQVRWAGRWVAFVDWSAPPSEENALCPPFFFPLPTPRGHRLSPGYHLHPPKLCLCGKLVRELSVYAAVSMDVELNNR